MKKDIKITFTDKDFENSNLKLIVEKEKIDESIKFVSENKNMSKLFEVLSTK